MAPEPPRVALASTVTLVAASEPGLLTSSVPALTTVLPVLLVPVNVRVPAPSLFRVEFLAGSLFIAPLKVLLAPLTPRFQTTRSGLLAEVRVPVPDNPLTLIVRPSFWTVPLTIRFPLPVPYGSGLLLSSRSVPWLTVVSPS